ncbi:MAG: serine hydrolase [Gammaproteobacteria bacterium]|nr:serine hydrolase [Gammaproteobacteria bacterium]MBT5202030.1 serine hydrolase [Gammaproteobacteria bacterium]MBT5600738.1 serine hydrolase [Gammaproteobacteria bacterium]MBT6244302.1 serine hydrolase [Gammaproteobacteria bacterium]
MTRFSALTLCSMLILVACTDAESPEKQRSVSHSQSWPDENWQLSTPEQEGLDGNAIATLDKEFRAGQHGYVDSMLIIRNGRMVFEAHYENDYQQINAPLITDESGPWNYYDTQWHPYYQGGELHTVQSSTKSFMSALVGIAIARGDLSGIDATLGELLPHRNIADPKKAAITLDNILTMRPGLEWEEDVSYWDPRNDAILVESTEDWVDYLLNKPMAHDQGTTYKYNSANTQLMSEIVSTATGQALDAYADQLLFGPIGISHYFWKDAPEGFKDVAGGLYFTARDFARFALLYQNYGLWNGHQVIPRAWVEASMQPHVIDTFPNDPDFNVGYGYQWWIFNDGTDGKPIMYGSWGWGGQFALIVPELDMIGVFTGWNIYDGLDYTYAYELFYDRIVLPAAPQSHAPTVANGR